MNWERIKCGLYSNTMTEIRLFDLIITLHRLFILHLRGVGQTICCKNPQGKNICSPGVKGQKMEMNPKLRIIKLITNEMRTQTKIGR